MSIEKSAAPALIPYGAGEITERLAAFAKRKTDRKSDDLLERCQVAASVLVTVDPDQLIPDAPADIDMAAMLNLVPATNETHPKLAAMSLPQSTRKRTLRQLHTADAMRQALSSHGDVPDSLLQRTFAKAIKLEPFNQATMSADELSALATVSDWLQGTEPGAKLPDPDALHSKVEQLSEKAALMRMAGEHFVGRTTELASIRTFVEGKRAGILAITGEGGAGKTALVSRAILDWIGNEPRRQERNFWVRLDLDYSMVRPDQPETVMTEIARRIAQSMPKDAAEEAARFIDRSSRFESGSAAIVESSSRTGFSYADLLSEFQHFLMRAIALSEGRRLLIWFDTFEEAQFLGDAVVDGMIDLAAAMCRLRQVRIIISGRPPIRNASDRIFLFSAIELHDLDPHASVLLLRRLAKGKVQPKQLTVLAEKVGGNPLTLRLVANLLRSEGKIDNAVLADVAQEALQQRLYSRILAHIHDEDVRKLAIPGVVMRRITTGVIREVLAMPCGLGPLDELRAQRIVQSLAEERTLVERESADVLRYRQDLRMVMLAGLSDAQKPMLKQIDQQAVDYWSKQQGCIAAAEAIYHRLRLRQTPEVLERYWSPQAAPLLRSTLEELPANSAQRLWLATKLQAVVDDRERDMADLREWEAQVLLHANRMLTVGRPKEALQVLSERRERLANSKLYAVESRAWLARHNATKAAEIAAGAIDALAEHSKGDACELALILAFAEQRRGRPVRAMLAVEKAVQFADISGDTLLQLQSRLRLLRLRRSLGQPSDGLAEIIVQQHLADLGGIDKLSKHPDVLRDLVAELGDTHPKWLRAGVDILLESLLETTPRKEVLALMLQFDLISQSSAQWLTLADATEFSRFARSRIEKALYGKRVTETFFVAMRDWFRRSIDDQVQERSWKVAAPKSPSAVRKLSKRVRTELIGLINRYPSSVLARIARYSLGLSSLSFSDGKQDGSDAGALIDHALKLRLFEHFIRELIQSAPDQDIRIELGSLFPDIFDLRSDSTS